MAREFRAVRAPRMAKNWDGVTGARATLTTTQAALFGIGFSSTFARTLLRLRGQFLLSAIPNAAADDDVVGLGFGIVSTDAAVAGGTALPSPLGDPGWPWVWHGYFPLIDQAATAADDKAIGNFVRLIVDSKAMRKMRSNESLVMIGHLSEGEYASVSIAGGIRVLFGGP